MKYSTTFVNKMITSVEGEERLYKARKMSARSVAKEGFKLIRTIVPSLGVGIDSLIGKKEELLIDEAPQTFTQMMMLLAENLSEDHFDDLCEKLTGELYFFDKKIEDLDDHFDTYPEDFITVIAWLGEENFVPFLKGNTMIQSLVTPLKTLQPKMKEKITNLLNDKEEDLNEK